MDYIPAKTILSGYRDDNEWFSTNYNMNIYRGCCHGCIYCDSRSECYRVEDFERVRAKENALALIERELASKRKTGLVASGAMSDPYNPFEAELNLTRGALELIDRYGFGASLATKSPLITRDIDVLSRIRAHSPVLCKMTVTAWDDDLAAKIEPHAPPPSARFQAVRELSQAGLFCGILLMPVLPFIEDTPDNIMGIVHLAAENGAKFIYPFFGVTLRQNQREYYFEKLDALFPDLKAEYLRLFGDKYACISPNAKALWVLFSEACQKAGILWRMSDIIKALRADYTQAQLSLFE